MNRWKDFERKETAGEANGRGGINPFEYFAPEEARKEEVGRGGIDPFYRFASEDAGKEEVDRGGINPFEHLTLRGEGEEGCGRGGIDPFEHFALEESCSKWGDKVEANDGYEKEAAESFHGKSGDAVKAEKLPQNVMTGLIKAEEATATNFSIHPLCRYIFIDRAGGEDSERAVIESIVVINGISHRFDVRVKDIRSLARIIQLKFPEAILDFEHKNVEKVIEMQYRQQLKNCRMIKVYFQAGWQRIDGNMRYLRDGMCLGEHVCVNTGMTLPTLSCYGGKEFLAVFDRTMSVCQDEATMSAIFAFSLTGILYRLFQNAGITPHFSMFLYGITGSMKTTIAKIFFVQLCEERYRENVRRIDMDTTVSLERAIVLAGHDTVTLIDDFSPAKTVAKKREMADKLEMIIRMVGDGSSRSRSSLKLEDLRGEGVQGMVALTGELMGKGLSSNLRCLYCKLEKSTVNIEVVTWFQENPFAYSTLLAAFADYVAEKYESIIEYIRREVKVQREKISKRIRERRLVDSAVVLCIAAQIFVGYMSEKLGQSPKIAQAKLKSLEAGIVAIVERSQALIEEELPGIEFVRAVDALMRMNVIALNNEKVKMTGATLYDGFEDDSYFYLNPESVHKKVVLFFKQTNRYFPYDLREIEAILADEGIIKTASNGTGKRTYCVRIKIDNGAKYNFLKIKKTIFEEICKGYFEDGNGMGGTPR